MDPIEACIWSVGDTWWSTLAFGALLVEHELGA